jgi:hypothetical protein
MSEIHMHALESIEATMHRCTGPVSCLPFEVVEKPNGL